MTTKTPFERLGATRKAAVETATAGCWEGTREIAAEIVHESRGIRCWRPMRAAQMLAQNRPAPVMYPEEFAAWRKDAKVVARIRKLGEHPREILDFPVHRYADLGSAQRTNRRGLEITRAEALACAHFIMGYAVPCGQDGLQAWFWSRFAQLAAAADALDMDTGCLSGYLRGYKIVSGQKELTPAPPTLIRALDWMWRNGPSSPYGPRPEYYPSADIPPADEES